MRSVEGKMLKNFLLILFIGFFISGQIWAQDFGFGFDDENTGSGSFVSGTAPSVSISGDVSAAIIGYLEEISEGPKHINTRDMFQFSGRLNFLARASFAEGAINLKLVPALVPVSIDEAYIRAFFGGLDIAAGMKKLTWGKADQFGPLDVINMPDSSRIFTEMADNSNLMSVKIASPIIHASYRFGFFSKIEGVFLPSFEITRMAVSSAISGYDPILAAISGYSSAEKWMPEQMKQLAQLGFPLLETDTSGLDYAQAGLRFTTSIGSADIGAQYFYGRMFQPAVKFHPPAETAITPSIELLFNKYHQIGFDYAQVLAGFNIRSEVAANITEDLSGDDGYIYNPSIGWSLGFDRDIIAGLNLNLQANGSIRLFDSKVGGSNIPFTPDFDNEAGTAMTMTRLTAMLSKKFLRDELEARAVAAWDIENADCAIMPALIWTKEDLRVAFSGGFFAGSYSDQPTTSMQLSQYRDNNFLKISLAYTF